MLRTILLLPLAALSLIAPQDPKPAAAVNTALVAQPRDGGWMQRHDQINAVVREHADAIDLVFVGDSITQGWEGGGKAVWAEFYGERRAANLGISGDRTEHVLWRLDNGNLDGIAPKVAVVMIGTNNFGHGTSSAEQILAGVRAVVARIRAKSPTTKVLLLDIFPRGETFNPMRGGILQVNQALQRLDDGENVVCLQIGHRFVEDDGSISKGVMPDFLHLTPDGYRRWAEAIEPTLARMLGS